MTLIQVTVIEGVFTAPQRREIVERLTDAMVEIEGEAMRRSIWCLVEEVASGHWGVGGQTPTADDVKALARSDTADLP
jgi:4-oxalocrotonate tautomerase